MKWLKKKYPNLSFQENFLGEHISIGRLTIYGENAMHWGVTFWTKRWGYICFRLPFRCFKQWWSLYFYLSPNGTPGASTLYCGSSQDERKYAPIRRKRFGHNFNTNLLDLDKPGGLDE